MVTWRRIALLAIAVESCRLQDGKPVTEVRLMDSPPFS